MPDYASLSMKQITATIVGIALFFILPFPLFGQDPVNKVSDTTTLAHFLKRGKFNGHVRSFFMATVNEGTLSDYYALATGAGIGYQTARWKGVTAGMSGFFIFNVASSDFGETDSLSGQKNRYEIGLFDLDNPRNRFDIYRLEELYLRYQHKKASLVAGRQYINTPFINKQDGRMRPSMAEGLNFQLESKSGLKIDAAWLTRVSPRTTVDWYRIGESIGIYPPGVNTDGTKSNYPGNTKSKSVAIAGVQYKNSLLHLQAWNTYVGNIMNTILLQPEIRLPVNKEINWMAGLQIVYQHGVGDGGNPEFSKRYYEKGGHTWGLAARMELKMPTFRTNINFLHISNNGRFLMPREWGREPFYTFLVRERNEGLGGVNAWTVNNEYSTKNKRYKFGLNYGQYFLPEPGNYRLNKYGLPSYQQLNLSADHNFKGFLKNMDLQLLLVWKGKLGNDPVAVSHQFNRVNMLNGNLVMNYHF
jgi:hypothetical protein